MPRKLTSDEIMDAIGNLEESTRKATARDILDDLKDFLKGGRTDDVPDTWEAGFQFAIDVIIGNYPTK